jgi:hypothetical protein
MTSAASAYHLLVDDEWYAGAELVILIVVFCGLILVFTW